jgi:hypothetical protein
VHVLSPPLLENVHGPFFGETSDETER